MVPSQGPNRTLRAPLPAVQGLLRGPEGPEAAGNANDIPLQPDGRAAANTSKVILGKEKASKDDKRNRK